jgi:hypothetical protein
MALASKRVQVVGVFAALVAVPFVTLAGLDVSLKGSAYLTLLTVSVDVVGALAAILFIPAIALTGQSRSGFCVAGALTAFGTALVYIGILAALRARLTNDAWLSVFRFYLEDSLVLFAPGFIILGVVAGLIASNKRFAT